MAPKLTKQEVRDVLLRLSTNGLTHAQNFYNCIVSGDTDFLEQYGSDPTLRPRAKAAVRNSKILHHVKQLLVEDVLNYVHYDSKNAFYVRVENRLNIRFKKLDENGRSSSSKTRRDEAFRRQEDCIPFEQEAPLSVNMDVGYSLDVLGANITGVTFSCPKDTTQIHWKIPARNLDIVENQQAMFAVPEEDTLPVLNIDLKEHLKKNIHGQQTGNQ